MPQQRGEDSGDRQADPERKAEGRRQQRVGIGADRVERDIAEVEQAGEADDDVEAPAQHHVDQDLDAVAVDPFQRAAATERQTVTARKQRTGTRRPIAARQRALRRRARRRAPARPRCSRLRRGLRRSGSPSRPRKASTTSTTTGDGPPDQMQRAVVGSGFGVEQDDRNAEHEGQRAPRRGVLQTPALQSAAAPSNLGSDRHRQTFSISGRPRMPEGMKIRVIARIENAATSL